MLLNRRLTKVVDKKIIARFPCEGGLFHFLTFSTIPNNGFNRYIEESNQRIMLDLTKKILRGVSFDAILFQKELNKGLKWISDAEEIRRFQEWCIVEFGAKYPAIINKAFAAKRVNA